MKAFNRRLAVSFLGSALLLLTSACDKNSSSEEAGKNGAPLVDSASLRGAAAFDRVKTFVELGPKPAGSPAAEKAAQWIHQQLVDLEIQSEIITFKDTTPGGSNTFHNVRGMLPGDPEKLVVIGCHFDTKIAIDDQFVGANDSGSGVGLLIEVANMLKAKGDRGPEIHFAFFDGEECTVHYSNIDGFHGSRHMADGYEADDRIKDIIAVIILDMIGHDDLTVTIPTNTNPYLLAKVFEASHHLNVRNHFRLFGRPIADDHTPFMNKGAPAIDLIDFAYGSAPSLNDYWHTNEDTLDKLSPDSLEIVGQVTLETLNLLHVQPTEEKQP